MKQLLLLLLVASFYNSQAQTATSKPRAVKQYTIEQFYKTINYGGGNFNKAENKILVQDNSTGIYNIYEIDLATKNKKPLTKSTKESYFVVDYIPGTVDFIYTADKGGNENDHLYLQRAGGTVTDLTPGEKRKSIFHRLEPAKDGIVLHQQRSRPKIFRCGSA